MKKCFIYASSQQDYVEAAERDMKELVQEFKKKYKNSEQIDSRLLADGAITSAVLEDQFDYEVRQDKNSDFADIIYSGRLANLIKKDMKEEGKNPDDSTEFSNYVKEKLNQDSLGEFIAEEGWTLAIFDVLPEIVYDIYQDHTKKEKNKS